jgi:hypothetical protein
MHDVKITVSLFASIAPLSGLAAGKEVVQVQVSFINSGTTA